MVVALVDLRLGQLRDLDRHAPEPTVVINGQRYVIENGLDAHEFVRRLVAERYGPDAEMVVNEIEVTGDEGRITVSVRRRPVVDKVDIEIVSVDLDPPGQQDG